MTDFTTLVANLAVTVAELRIRMERIEKRVYRNEKRQDRHWTALADADRRAREGNDEFDAIYEPYMHGDGDAPCGEE